MWFQKWEVARISRSYANDAIESIRSVWSWRVVFLLWPIRAVRLWGVHQTLKGLNISALPMYSDRPIWNVVNVSLGDRRCAKMATWIVLTFTDWIAIGWWNVSSTFENALASTCFPVYVVKQANAAQRSASDILTVLFFVLDFEI